MSHDPLCRSSEADWDYGWCLCDLIRKVREHERETFTEWAVKQSARHVSWLTRRMSRIEASYEEGRGDVLNMLLREIRVRNRQMRQT